MSNRAGGITPEQFVEKWSKANLSERAASQEHFIDLCHLLDQPTPAEADSSGDDYCFEKHVKVVGSASKGSKGDFGFVDVWKRGFFAWEYKRKDKHKSLDEAYRQLYQYRDDLDNPPLSVVCDIRTTVIRAHFPGYPTEKTVIELEEIPGRLEVLRRVFTSPNTFKPSKSREEETTDLAEVFGDLADKLLSRTAAVADTLWEGHGDPVAHFLMKVMFCLFAEDVELLPDKLFTRLVNRCLFEPEEFKPSCQELFDKMKTGGRYGNDKIAHFNGGLFDDAPPLALNSAELQILGKAATRPWQAVEPSIFGTLFERILDPKKRAQIGAHYTSKTDILLVVDPVVMTPLKRKWSALQQDVAPNLQEIAAEKDRKKRDVIAALVRMKFDDLRRHLGEQRILDPACGSGNFLYVALQQLLNLDDEIVRFAARYDIAMSPYPYIRPSQLHGIEINPYAAELAQNVIWIGYLQWIAEHHIDNPKRPILDKLTTIENRDAILDLSKPKLPTPAQWPGADFIIGNPPFLGSKLFRSSGISDEYLSAMGRVFDLPRTSDLCCYWFELARRALPHQETRVGLLATQAIRGGDNREVLRRIKADGDLFYAWSDRDWVLDGAAVHVSIVGFDAGIEKARSLNNIAVEEIHADLSSGLDVLRASTLSENANVLQSVGTQKTGDFDVEYPTTRQLLAAPTVTSQAITKVLRPWINGVDMSGRPRGRWIIDFGTDRSLKEAAEFDAALAHVDEHVKPQRQASINPAVRDRWWIHERPRPELRPIIDRLPRSIVTTRHSVHRIFAWMQSPTLPDSALICFGRDDDYFLGVLHSAPHELWARRMGTQLREAESGFRYTPSTCFETFPLPWPPGKEDVKHPAYKRIAEAAKALNEQRERWLNPPEWIEPLAAKIDAADKFEERSARSESARPPIRYHGRRRQRRAAEESHAHEALQRAPHLAKNGPRTTRPRGVSRLRRHRSRRRLVRRLGRSLDRNRRGTTAEGGSSPRGDARGDRSKGAGESAAVESCPSETGTTGAGKTGRRSDVAEIAVRSVVIDEFDESRFAQFL
jgi:hypothetical protein